MNFIAFAVGASIMTAQKVFARIRGCSVIIELGEPTGRGTEIKIAYSCEWCGRTWVEIQQFHKGNVLTAIKEIEQNLPDIWRD
jgi:hypothetical protein